MLASFNYETKLEITTSERLWGEDAMNEKRRAMPTFPNHEHQILVQAFSCWIAHSIIRFLL